jgi:transglutaminase-like putative cysteine protease
MSSVTHQAVVLPIDNLRRACLLPQCDPSSTHITSGHLTLGNKTSSTSARSGVNAGATALARYVPQVMTRPRVYRTLVPRGYRGTRTTVANMRALIRAGAKDFYVRQHAIDVLLTKGVPAKDYEAEIRTMFEWVQRHVRYTRDPFGVEVLHSARRMLELRAGDCDDMSIVLGALLEAIGHQVRIVLTGTDSSRPQLFTHVYIEAYCRGRWIALDATMPYPMGWAPRAPVKKVMHTGGRS